jgi:hypothetical protein
MGSWLAHVKDLAGHAAALAAVVALVAGMSAARGGRATEVDGVESRATSHAGCRICREGKHIRATRPPRLAPTDPGQVADASVVELLATAGR